MPPLASDSPVQYVKGIGPAKAQWLAGLGIRTVGELLEYFPFRHEQETGEVEIADLQPGLNATVRGTVLRIRGRGRRSSVTAEIYDGTERCVLRWFHQPYDARGLYEGATVIATGTVRAYNDRLELVQPRVQVFPPDAVVFPHATGARVVGVYRGNAQASSSLIRRAVLGVLGEATLPVEEFLPDEVRRHHRLPAREAAIRQMHCPTGETELRGARRRLAYEEFFLLELAMALRRHKTVALEVGQKLHVTPEVDRRIRARFPFQLTASQNHVVREIVADLESGRPMTRLLQGDVGSGKTVVALYACLAAIASGKQAAVMAPTEILAQQHFANVAHYLAGSKVRYMLLRGKLGPRQRRDALAAIEHGAIDLVIGTQALIQRDVAFRQLALVVVDEQHKFGVLQRAAFRTKGPLPHYLVMTATPIPRTLSMTVFGDLDVSILREGPPGRGLVTTKVVSAGQWDTVMQYVRRRLEAGEQAYVVCPLIGEDAEVAPEVAELAERTSNGGRRAALVSANETHRRLVGGPWHGLDVGLLHGELRPAEKARVINAFAAGQLQAVVATTVVEVGVDVANATIMLIEHADRFGLSQLHQLRGRIGRGHKDSLCVLIAHDTPPTQTDRPPSQHAVLSTQHSTLAAGRAGERLAVLAQTSDGFKIAEADLRLRGPGELLGTRQHGLPELWIGDLVNDFELLEKARADAFDLVRHDPGLRRPEHQALMAALKRLFRGQLALIDAA